MPTILNHYSRNEWMRDTGSLNNPIIESQAYYNRMPSVLKAVYLVTALD